MAPHRWVEILAFAVYHLFPRWEYVKHLFYPGRGKPFDTLESVEETVDIEAAVTDVKKTFLLGQRADAFESEYVTETEAAINESEERSPHLERLLRQVKSYQYQTARPTIVVKWLFPPRPVELRV